MRIIQTSFALRAALAERGGSVGLVPTMGGLHAGHLALVSRARVENDVVVVSIFVNPAQFDEVGDFADYPRDLERDLVLLNEQADIVFSPTPEEMYPENADVEVHIPRLSRILLGEIRPGHFVGVATVVTKLLMLVNPTRSYFGEKDFQQLHIIRHLVRGLFLSTEVIGLPTVRDSDGLALSSRNMLLSQSARAAAVVLPQALRCAEGLSVQTVSELTSAVRAVLSSEPLAEVVSVEVRQTSSLEPIQEALQGEVVLLLAVRFEGVLLIDHTLLNFLKAS